MQITHETNGKDLPDYPKTLACIEALRELDKRLKECAETPASAADAYDSFYRGMVADALAAVGDA